MPTLDDAQLAAALATGQIGAISVDTSIFSRYQDNLNARLLIALQQFRGTSVPLILSEVVVGEIKAHIAAVASESKDKLWTALRRVRTSWDLDFDRNDAINHLGVSGDATDRASQLVDAYVALVGAQVLTSTGHVDVSKVVSMYFSVTPPFGTSADKKHGFPDAIALLALDDWAAKQGTQMVVVSSDGDWKNFADASPNLICVEDLPKALSLFNAQVRFIASRAVAALGAGAAKEFYEAVESALEYASESFDPDYDAESSFQYELDSMEVVLDQWQIKDFPELEVVFSDEDEIVFTFKVISNFDFYASFRFSVRDSIDRDYINMGSSRANTSEVIELELTVSMEKKIEPEPSIYSIEVTQPRFSLRFGNVDPDWGE